MENKVGTLMKKVYYGSISLILVLVVNFVFRIGLTNSFAPMFENRYLYLLLAFTIPLVFIKYPANTSKSRNNVPWYDLIFAIVSCILFIVLAFWAMDINVKGWAFLAPNYVVAVSVIILLLVLEAIRRTAGIQLFVFSSIMTFFPIFTIYLPGILRGRPMSLLNTITYHVIGADSLVGMSTLLVGQIVIGYLLFGAAILAAGGGDFFLDLGSALLGKQRGGPAKISVISSALFGSLSGSVVANVLTTGAFTIPAMKKTGYPDYYAAAVEATASTGGAFMPPVMGVTAFLIAAFLNVSYFSVAVAATIPALLYYFVLFVQIDGQAAKLGLKGLDADEIPSLKETLKKGIFIILGVFVLLIFLYLGKEPQAPFYASVVLILGSLIKKETRNNLSTFFRGILDGVGTSIITMMTIVCACGLIIGSFSVTGVAHAFASAVVGMAGDGNIFLMLIYGFITSAILGMGMPIIATYIFLVIVVVPGLVAGGVYPLAAHLFIMYSGLISYVTPPVALGSYTAATVAKANPTTTAWQAIRLAISIYFVPFLFVYNPALLLHGTLLEIIYSVLFTAIGFFFLASGVEGYLFFMGKLQFIIRLPLIIGGILFSLPKWDLKAAGFLLILLALIGKILISKKSKVELIG